MSVSPPLLSIDEVEQRLAAVGILPTAQRIAIGRFVLGTDTHPSAERIKHWLEQNFPKVSLPTVYNTLNTFVASGLLRELKLPNTAHVCYDCNTAPHAHFLDLDSGEVRDLPMAAIAFDPTLAQCFEFEQIDVVIRGRHRVSEPSSAAAGEHPVSDAFTL